MPMTRLGPLVTKVGSVMRSERDFAYAIDFNRRSREPAHQKALCGENHKGQEESDSLVKSDGISPELLDPAEKTARRDCASRTVRGRGSRLPSSQRRFRAAASRLLCSRLLCRPSGPGPSAAHSDPRPHGPWYSFGTGLVPLAGIRRARRIRPRGDAIKPPPGTWMGRVGGVVFTEPLPSQTRACALTHSVPHLVGSLRTHRWNERHEP